MHKLRYLQFYIFNTALLFSFEAEKFLRVHVLHGLHGSGFKYIIPSESDRSSEPSSSALQCVAGSWTSWPTDHRWCRLKPTPSSVLTLSPLTHDCIFKNSRTTIITFANVPPSLAGSQQWDGQRGGDNHINIVVQCQQPPAQRQQDEGGGLGIKEVSGRRTRLDPHQGSSIKESKLLQMGITISEDLSQSRHTDAKPDHRKDSPFPSCGQ